MDRFDDNNKHFLEIAIDKVDTDLYYKLTHRGQYSSFIVVFFGIIKLLYHHSKKKYALRKKNLNSELIKLNYLCHVMVIHL